MRFPKGVGSEEGGRGGPGGVWREWGVTGGVVCWVQNAKLELKKSLRKNYYKILDVKKVPDRSTSVRERYSAQYRRAVRVGARGTDVRRA